MVHLVQACGRGSRRQFTAGRIHLPRIAFHPSSSCGTGTLPAYRVTRRDGNVGPPVLRYTQQYGGVPSLARALKCLPKRLGAYVRSWNDFDGLRVPDTVDVPRALHDGAAAAQYDRMFRMLVSVASTVLVALTHLHPGSQSRVSGLRVEVAWTQ